MMEIIVLTKRVPATDVVLEIADDRRSIRNDQIPWILNPYDELALEEALRIRERHGGTVAVVGLGPPQVEDVLRIGLALGADRAVLVESPPEASVDPLVTARQLAAALVTMPFDLVLAGQRSVDAQNGIVGPAVAELLGIPHLSAVVELEIGAGVARCRRALEEGGVVMEAPLPVLLTAERGLNEPRHMSLKGIRAARSKPLERMAAEESGPDRSQTRLISLKPPRDRRRRERITGGDARWQATELVRRLRQNPDAP